MLFVRLFVNGPKLETTGHFEQQLVILRLIIIPVKLIVG